MKDETPSAATMAAGPVVAGLGTLGLAFYYHSSIPAEAKPRAFVATLITAAASLLIGVRSSHTKPFTSDEDRLGRATLITVGGLGYGAWILLERSPEILAPLFAALGGALTGAGVKLFMRARSGRERKP